MLDRLRLHVYPKEPLTCAKLTQYASLKLETKRRAKPTLHLLHVGRRKEKLRSAEAGAAADPKHKESSAMEVSGLDSDGKEFKNAEEMWREQIGEDGEQQEKKTHWYREGISYWEVSSFLFCFFFFFFSFFKIFLFALEKWVNYQPDLRA